MPTEAEPQIATKQMTSFAGDVLKLVGYDICSAFGPSGRPYSDPTLRAGSLWRRCVVRIHYWYIRGHRLYAL